MPTHNKTVMVYITTRTVTNILHCTLLSVRMDHVNVKIGLQQERKELLYFPAEGSRTQDTKTITSVFNRNAGIVAFPAAYNYSRVDSPALAGHAL